MCESCDEQLRQMGVDPSSLVAQMGMAMEIEASQREQARDQSIRLGCLELAVKVKGHDNDSRKVLSSANAYYDFVTNKDKVTNDND